MNVETALLTGRDVVTELQRVTDEDAEVERETENDTEGEVEAGILFLDDFPITLLLLIKSLAKPGVAA